MSQLNKAQIGSDVEGQHKNDWAEEDDAVKAYNEDIRLAVEVGDNESRELLEGILKDEEHHIDWPEAQLDQIKLMEQIGEYVLSSVKIQVIYRRGGRSGLPIRSGETWDIR